VAGGGCSAGSGMGIVELIIKAGLLSCIILRAWVVLGLVLQYSVFGTDGVHCLTG